MLFYLLGIFFFPLMLFMGLGGWWRRNRKKRWVHIGAPVMVVASIAIGTVTLHKGQVPPPPNNTVRINIKTGDATIPAESTWTQTGGERCFVDSAAGTTATCYAAGPAKMYHATCGGLAFVPEKGRINRVKDNEGANFDCAAANWGCLGAGATTTGQTDPEGNSAATKMDFTVTGTDRVRSAQVTGYTADAILYMRVWVKCTGAETLRLINDTDTTKGRWAIDCSVVNGSWVLLHSSHAAVSVVSAWKANASGNIRPRFQSETGALTAYAWGMTLTETDGISTIPTAAAAVDTGDVSWSWNNATGDFWAAGDTVTSTIADEVGTCWVTGATLYLSGSPGSECTGVICEHKVTRP